MTEYVVGFLFNKRHGYVVLIEKNRPEWQRGLLNGVGGHIEFNETAHDAMVREFWEETNVEINDWKQFTTLSGPGFKVHFFYAFAAWATIDKVITRTDEKVTYYKLADLNTLKTIPNIKWLIPMALSMEHDKAQSFVVQEIAAATLAA